MEKTAYNFKELEAESGEGSRLTAQAEAFVDLELPFLLESLGHCAKIADFGCGNGVITRAIAGRLPQSQIWGLDPDARALEIAGEGGRTLKNLNYARFGFGEPEVPGGPYDAVFTRLVLMHLADPGAAIEQMKGALKPGGLIYLVDCDDAYMNFLPHEPWQEDLAAFMQKAQELRGGSRNLGSVLLALLQSKGLWPGGSRVLYYSSEKLGMERWKNIFLPAMGNMAERDLQFLLARGWDSSRIGSLRLHLKDYFGRDGVRVQLSAWHAWARRID